MKEKIDILLTTYNTEIDFLKKQINSILNQTYKNIHLLISDDNSKNKEIISVTINKKPTKKNYVQNLEELDLSGGEIKVTYDDGSSKLISMTNNKVSCSGFSNEKVGTSTVTIK